MKIKYVFVLLFAMAAMSACSPRLAGTWTVQKYETTTPGQQGISLNNIGTLTFDRSGDGIKDIRYTVFGNVFEDQIPFNWSVAGNMVIIRSEGSEFAKSWIQVENKKSFQRWQSTDGAEKVTTLELIR